MNTLYYIIAFGIGVIGFSIWFDKLRNKFYHKKLSKKQKREMISE